MSNIFNIPWNSNFGLGLSMEVVIGPTETQFKFKNLDKNLPEAQTSVVTLKTIFPDILTTKKRPKLNVYIRRQYNLPKVLVDSKWESPYSETEKYIIIK